MTTIDRDEARRVIRRMLDRPAAPGVYSHLINAGTNKMLDVLENYYFAEELKEGISCFKYVQGYYGSGKTQFINSLAARAWRAEIVTSVVDVGQDCPFNSPAAIYKAVVSSFLPPPERGVEPAEQKGIEVLFQYWIDREMRRAGVTLGHEVPTQVRIAIERPFKQLFLGAKDVQAASGLQALGSTLIEHACGGELGVGLKEVISWVRGDRVASRNLRDRYALSEPLSDANALNRLMTVLTYLRKQMGFRGFLIAFDEGTRTASFRRGSAKQRQAIENMLTMINKNKPGEFDGVMFVYAATPDFKNEVVRNYVALNDRIGDVAFSVGVPMVPFIDLDNLDTEKITFEIGANLLDLFSQAYGVTWDRPAQEENVRSLYAAEKAVSGIGPEVRRYFTYHHCVLLKKLVDSGETSRSLGPQEAESFVRTYRLPGTDM